MPLKTRFEKQVCERCGGCGQYSYNQISGSTCFGCGGKGETLTPIGVKARGFLMELCTIKAGDLVPGDRVTYPGCNGFVTFEAMGPFEKMGTSTVDGVTREVFGHTFKFKGQSLRCAADFEVRRSATEAEYEKALAYQETLKAQT